VSLATASRWCGRLALGLALVLGLMFVALRIVVARVPAYSADIRAWVERETRLTLDFDSLDARLRWFGPEVVLRGAKLYEPVDRQPLFTTREARIALDLWSLFRTGELVAGRLRLIGPEVVVVRLPDGRIRLLNQLERPADRPSFDLDRLPAGRVDIVDAGVEFRDRLAKRAPLRLTDLDLHLVRRENSVQATGIARLPRELGDEIELEGSLAGRLMQPSSLRGRIDAQIDDALLPGWGKLLPAGLARVDRGSGTLRARLDFTAGRIDEARLDVDTEDVALELPARRFPGIETVLLTKEPVDHATPLRLPGLAPSFTTRPAAATPRSATFSRLAAKLRLRRDGAAWIFRIAELEAAPAGSRRGHALRALGDLSGRLAGNLRTTYTLRIDARDLRVGELWPLAIAFAPPAADRWLGLSPSGDIHALSLDARRPRAGAIPEFRVSADVHDLSLQPTGRLPGVQRLTAVVSGTDERGRISLRSEHAVLRWPRMFLAPLLAGELRGDFDWTRDGREWRLAGHDLRIERPGLAARGSGELRYVSAARSPYLVLDLDVDAADARLVQEFLPAGRLKARPLAWLERAFIAGEATGHLAYRGPTRKFPFRYGEGEFLATAQVRGATLDYFPGFARLTDAVGTVRFHNSGLDGELTSGRVADLSIRRGQFAIPDLRNAVIDIDADAEGDVGAALGYLQGSPLAPRLGPLVNQLSGSGPADYAVSLTLPLRDLASRDYRVRAEFRSATLRLPALRAPVVDLTGTFDLHNLDAHASDLRGLFLDGPFTASVAPDDDGHAPASDGAVAVNVQAVGRASGSRLPAFIGLPDGIGMRGVVPWDLALRSARPSGTAAWTTHVNVATNLVGLAIDAPKPFAKIATEARDTRVRLDLNPDDRRDVAIESGRARAQLSFLERDGRWQLERGLARFDGGPMPRTLRTGLQVVGDWPEFDLGEWLALGSSSGGRGQLADWLGRVDVRLEQARVFGYELRDVQAQLAEDGTNWLVDLECPMIEGRVTVPLDARSDQPILLELEKLALQSAPAAPAAEAARPPVDPRRLQSLHASIDDFTWEGRHFGRLVADVRSAANGLNLTSLETEAPEFSFVGNGSWLVDDAGQKSALVLEFNSTNLAAAAQALGYRQSIEAEKSHAKADLHWAGAPSGDDLLSRLEGTVRIDLGRGRLRNVEPGAAGRVLGLMSVVELPRRLALDFRDVTEEGLAFDSVGGDFRLTGGNAYTENLLLKGAAVDIGIAGRTGLASQDYDQTVVVSGNPSGPLTVAGALAAGPVIGAGVLVLSQLFKGQLQGLTKVYYRITGPWSEPVVQRVSSAGSEGLAAQGVAQGATRGAARESPR
jgi:uncharacterized protein (TIGR02099 family)